MSSSEITTLAKPILDRTIIVIAASIVIGALLVGLMILSISRPLNRLMKGAERISRGI
ncbi:hypothetical protein LJK87_02205 [Paenibacillus sp. P25]|nr:hypothetical protein LJK87_02205 [Paenibacillus sp. P25]